MELHHLYYILMLAQEKNFSRAAEKLFITQPTLSQQVKKLEHELGFPIFQRSTKNVTLTSYGELFVARAQKVITEFEDFQQWTVQIRKQKSTKLSFGTSALTAPHASACIPDFINQFPEVQFIHTEQWDPTLMNMVKDGELDIALVGLPRNDVDRAGLHIFPILEEHVCVVMSRAHPLHDRESVTLQDLANEQILVTSSESGLTRLMKSEFALRGLNPNFMLNLISIEARLSMVIKGAVTFVMNRQFEWYNQKDLAVIPIEPKIHRTLALIAAANREISVVEKTFIQIIKEGVAKRLEAS
ncbi:MAG: LysR family transcriptional regulator [Oscillospiraceae bacterium]